MQPERIRPLALGIVWRGDELLVFEGYDRVKDEVFYRNSGGGVTVSGGSPLLHPEFVAELFRSLKRHAVHTALETCGAVPWNHFEKVQDCTDLFLYDLKHLDAETHETYTGCGNDLILENLVRLDKEGARIIVRVPVIPSFNDDPESIAGIARFTMKLSSKPPMHLLPYHTLGRSKYHHLEREYPLERQGMLLVSTLDELEATARKINPRTTLEV